jgi:hypothetical protein
MRFKIPLIKGLQLEYEFEKAPDDRCMSVPDACPENAELILRSHVLTP